MKIWQISQEVCRSLDQEQDSNILDTTLVHYISYSFLFYRVSSQLLHYHNNLPYIHNFQKYPQFCIILKQNIQHKYQLYLNMNSIQGGSQYIIYYYLAIFQHYNYYIPHFSHKQNIKHHKVQYSYLQFLNKQHILSHKLFFI